MKLDNSTWPDVLKITQRPPGSSLMIKALIMRGDLAAIKSMTQNEKLMLSFWALEEVLHKQYWDKAPVLAGFFIYGLVSTGYLRVAEDVVGQLVNDKNVVPIDILLYLKLNLIWLQRTFVTEKAKYRKTLTFIKKQLHWITTHEALYFERYLTAQSSANKRSKFVMYVNLDLNALSIIGSVVLIAWIIVRFLLKA